MEIDLDSPLKSFIQLYNKPFGVVYEAVSTIYFNCGCYGHVKERCPYGEQKNMRQEQQDGAQPSYD